jgi:hypothetical protein
VAEALVTVIIALTAKEPGAPDAKVLRQALFSWAFNPATRQLDQPPETAPAPAGQNAPRSGADALGTTEPEPGPGGEGDDNSGQAS